LGVVAEHHRQSHSPHITEPFGRDRDLQVNPRSRRCSRFGPPLNRAAL
jgi:hypothetical protein